MIGIYISFNDIEYIGYEEVNTMSEAQNAIAEEINKNSRYVLKNTVDGDIMFPTNAMYISEIKMTKISENNDGR